jgi:hypothetical protein
MRSGCSVRKKFTKALAAVKESDVVLYLIGPVNFRVDPFQDLFALTERRWKTSAMIFNHFQPPSPKTERELLQNMYLSLIFLHQKVIIEYRGAIAPEVGLQFVIECFCFMSLGIPKSDQIPGTDPRK